MKKTGKSFFIIMIAVTAVILAIMAVSFKTETSASSAAGSVFAPVQKAAAFVVNGISGGIADIKNSSKNARSLKLLKKKNYVRRKNRKSNQNDIPYRYSFLRFQP